MELVVIADDFTGANDTGVQFSKKGFRTVLSIYGQDLNLNPEGVDVLVVDTESRFDKMDAAFQKSGDVLKHTYNKDKTYIYKKLDSTMRGNPGAEIDGVMRAAGINLALVTPSFPKNGRTVMNGVLLVNGVPVAETEVSKDPVTPVNYSYIPDILGTQMERKIECVGISKVREGVSAILEDINELASKGVEIIALDAENDDDLSAIAKAAAKIDGEFIMAGSAGLAEFIPGNLMNSPWEKGGRQKNKPEGCMAVVAGSVSDVMRKQVEYALNDGNFEVIDVNLDNVISKKGNEEIESILSRIKGYADNGKDVIIRSAGKRDQVDYAREIGAKIGLSNFQVSDIISNFFGELTKHICSNIKLRGLFLSGGDVAIKAARALEIQGIDIQDEILPGIPYGYFIGPRKLDMPVVTKAGGFGKENAIIEVVNYLDRR